MKPALTFTLPDPHRKVCLFNEGGTFVWRWDSHLGDECELLYRAGNLAQAKREVRRVFAGKDWQASWK